MLPGPHPAPGALEAHLWIHHHRADVGYEQITALLSLLSPDEHTRLARLRDNRRRRQFAVGRALCRRVLSQYAPVPPQGWNFALGSRGKPFVTAPALPSPLWFNLSHTDGASICAVTGAGPDIGVDIERLAPERDALEIAEQFFPQAEANALRLLPTPQRHETFMRLWALKESFAKAGETSLADGISGTSFDLAPLDDIGVTFGEPLHERAQDWSFKLVSIDPARIVALAVHKQTTGPLHLRTGTFPGLL